MTANLKITAGASARADNPDSQERAASTPPTKTPSPKRRSSPLISGLPENYFTKDSSSPKTQEESESPSVKRASNPPLLLASKFKSSPESEARVDFNVSLNQQHYWTTLIAHQLEEEERLGKPFAAEDSSSSNTQEEVKFPSFELISNASFLLGSKFKSSPESEARVDFNVSLNQKHYWTKLVALLKEEEKSGKPFDAPKNIEKSRAAYEEQAVKADAEYGENYGKLIESIKEMGPEEQHNVLNLAIYYRNAVLLNVLFEQEVNVTAPDSNGILPIHVAASRGSLKILKSLVVRGANINEPNAFGEKAWQIALINKNKEAIPYLLENSKDSLGNFPVHSAAACGDTRMLGALRDQGGNFLKLNENNQTALQVAFANKNTEAIDFFKELYSYFWGPSILEGESDKHNLVEHMSPDERIQALYIAVDSKDEQMIDCLARCGVNINSPDKNGDLPIHIAAVRSNSTAIFYLVQAGSSLDALTTDGRTVLQTADLYQSEEVLNYFKKLYISGFYTPKSDLDKELLAKNMSPDEGVNELNRAILRGDRAMMKFLLKCEVDVNSKNDKGELPIHLVAMNGDAAALQHLVTAGADLNKLTADGGSILQIAEFYGQEKIFTAMAGFYCNGSYIPNSDSDKELLAKNMSMGERPKVLHSALLQSDRVMMEFLFKYGVNVNSKNDKGEYPIHHVAAKGDVDTLQRLVAMGATPNELTASRKSILHIAERFDAANVSAFIKQLYFSDVYIPNSNSDKELLAKNMSSGERVEALNKALLQGDRTMMGILFRNGVNVNLQNPSGNLPIHYAAALSDVDTLQHLIDMQADLNARNKDLKTIVQIARDSGHPEAINFLKQRYLSQINYTLQYDLDKGILVQEMNGDERTVALHKAVVQEDLSMVDILLKNKVSLNAKVDSHHNLPIHLLANHGGTAMFSYFLENKPELNATNKYGETALQISVDSGNQGVSNLIKDFYLSNNDYIPSKRSDKQSLVKIMSIQDLKSALAMNKSKKDITMVTLLNLELLRKRILSR